MLADRVGRWAATAGVALCLSALAAFAPAADEGAAPAASDSALSAPAPAGKAVVPGRITTTATLRCIGIMWEVTGDANADATCAVEYRKAGADKWREALPLYRKAPLSIDIEKSVAGNRPIPFLGGLSKWDAGTRQYAIDHWRANYLAGSIFSLEPGGSYEVKLTLSDPDAKAAEEKVLTVRTRPEPVLPSTGNIIDVTDKDGPDALAKAVSAAKAGDIFVVHKGTYSQVTLRASGTAEKPIVIRGAGDGPAVIKGPGHNDRRSIALYIYGSHIFIHDIDVTDAWTGIALGLRERDEIGNRDNGHSGLPVPDKSVSLPWQESGKPGLGVISDISITRCRVTGPRNAIFGMGDNCYFADNVLEGDSAGGMGGEGVEVWGSGTVICHNDIFHFADGISVYPHTSDQDVYNNNIFDCSDDAIELDYSDYNNRVWDNRFRFNGNNSISFQSYIGGPCYIVRNQVVGSIEGCIKDRYGSSDVYLLNNTFVGHPQFDYKGVMRQIAPTDLPMNIVSRNNLYLIDGTTDFPCVDIHPAEFANRTADLDYDGMGGYIMSGKVSGATEADAKAIPGARWEPKFGVVMSVETFQKATGRLTHWTAVDPARDLAAPLPKFRLWNERDEEPETMFTLSKDSAAIDAGVVLPTLNEEFAGKAPDLGALESGKPAPAYGPRAAAEQPL